MAFSSQSFAAPSIPKLNRRTISSPLSSSASKISGVAPKLKISRMRFFRPSLKKTNVTAEAITQKKTNVPVEAITQKSSIVNTLAETNTILVEIQKQLAYDFAMRIAEEKEKNKVLKEDKSRRKLALKEGAIESTRKIGNIVKSATGKMLAPVKGVFDKIMEFLSIIGTGIAANAVFEWLKDDENKQKLQGWFNFIVEHWKWGLAALGAVAALKLVGPISVLVKVISGTIGLLAKAIPFLLKGLGIMATPLFLKVMLAIGAGVLAYKGAQGIRNLITGGEDFSAAHSELDKQLTDAGLVASGPNAGKIKKKKGTNRGSYTFVDPTDPETIALRDELLKKRKALYALKDEMNAEIKEKQSKLEIIPTPSGSRRRKMGADPNEAARKKVDMEVKETYKPKISDILNPTKIEARKMGGPVTAGNPYIVGEKGPEFFIPNINGSVVNNYKTEKIYQMISSKNAGKINFITMDLPPQVIKKEKSIPTPPAPPVPNISSTNAADLWRVKTPDIYGIYV